MFKALWNKLIHGGRQANYVSEADQFLQKFDQEHSHRTESQRREFEKHRDIFKRKADSRIKW